MPAATLPELIALAKAKPNTLNFASGPGSMPYLAGELLKQYGKIEMTSTCPIAASGAGAGDRSAQRARSRSDVHGYRRAAADVRKRARLRAVAIGSAKRLAEPADDLADDRQVEPRARRK